MSRHRVALPPERQEGVCVVVVLLLALAAPLVLLALALAVTAAFPDSRPPLRVRPPQAVRPAGVRAAREDVVALPTGSAPHR